MRLRDIRSTVVLCLLALSAAALLQPAEAETAVALAGPEALKAQYQQLQGPLKDNPFKRPIVLESTEASSAVKGEIHAVLDYPFAEVRAALATPANWCDVLILHLNTKYCRLSTDNGKTMLRMHVGKKIAQELDDTYRVDFNYRSGAASSDYFSSSMQAAKGPLDTSDYSIQIEAIPLPDNRSFLHLSYSYSYGMASKLAMRAYLMTVGRDKVGFTETSRKPDGQPVYVTGTRATVERNTMRYYLAIDAWLANQHVAAGERQEKRLENWYAATEQYPRQLHEVDRADYLAMKKKELERQQKELP